MLIPAVGQPIAEDDLELRATMPRTACSKSNAYRYRHKQLARRLGPAKRYRCADCGKPAIHWSLNERAVPAKFLRVERHQGKLVLYSIGPDTHYSPRCGLCHLQLDRQALKSKS
jgi:hypothetical protein